MTESLKNVHFNRNLAKNFRNVEDQKNIQKALSLLRGCVAIHCNHCGFYHCSVVHFIVGGQFGLPKQPFVLNYFRSHVCYNLVFKSKAFSYFCSKV